MLFDAVECYHTNVICKSCDMKNETSV